MLPVASPFAHRKHRYYLNATIILHAEDSHLVLAAYPGELATISGGVHIEGRKWKPIATGSPIWGADLSDIELPQGVPALQVDGKRATLARCASAMYIWPPCERCCYPGHQAGPYDFVINSLQLFFLA